MEVEIDFSKTVDENASAYFEKSKSLRKKIAGLEKYIEVAQGKLSRAQQEKKTASAKPSIKRKRWFFSFRWFFSSDGLLVIGGRDAKSNEELVKKRMKPNDLYFHAEVFGAPHCFVQAPEDAKGKEVVFPDATQREAAQFAASFSKAWEEGRAVAEVYSVKPEQVSKSAKSGEFLSTGAFMIYGERNWFRKTVLNCAIGFFSREQALMCGPVSAIRKHCKTFFELKQGEKTKEQAARELAGLFEKKGLSFSVDEFVSLLPNGQFGIV